MIDKRLHNFFRLPHTAYMKKFLFLITSILAIGTACIAAGCNGNEGGPDAKNERSYTVGQDGEDQSPEKDDDCEDGGCEDKRLPEGLPEFRFRPHRPFNPQGDNSPERKTGDDSDGNGDTGYDSIEPIRPQKKRPNKNNPAPKPMPVKPKK